MRPAIDFARSPEPQYTSPRTAPRIAPPVSWATSSHCRRSSGASGAAAGDHRIEPDGHAERQVQPVDREGTAPSSGRPPGRPPAPRPGSRGRRRRTGSSPLTSAARSGFARNQASIDWSETLASSISPRSISVRPMAWYECPFWAEYPTRRTDPSSSSIRPEPWMWRKKASTRVVDPRRSPGRGPRANPRRSPAGRRRRRGCRRARARRRGGRADRRGSARGRPSRDRSAACRAERRSALPGFCCREGAARSSR